MIVTWRLDYGWKGGPFHDGDSFHVVGDFSGQIPIDLVGYEAWGPVEFQVPVKEMTRLAHCNAPELSTPAGVAARSAVIGWFQAHLDQQSDLPLEIYGREKYKRLLCDVILTDGSKLSDFVLGLPGSVPMKLTEQLV